MLFPGVQETKYATNYIRYVHRYRAHALLTPVSHELTNLSRLEQYHWVDNSTLREVSLGRYPHKEVLFCFLDSIERALFVILGSGEKPRTAIQSD
jgi:hypothetical protein